MNDVKKMYLCRIYAFSKKSHVGFFRLLYIFYFPRPRIRLTDALKISGALGVSVDKCSDIHFDIRRECQV